MFDRLRSNGSVQLVLGLVSGIAFGFLLQRGGVTRYEVLIGQLLLQDFTVVKVMLTAALVGMIGIYAMKYMGWVNLSIKPGSFGSSVVGGLIFGAGFGILGYCPGTVTGAAAQGSLDALIGGIPGLLAGCWLYAAIYPSLRDGILGSGEFGKETIPDMLPLNSAVGVVACGLLMLGVLGLLEVLSL